MASASTLAVSRRGVLQGTELPAATTAVLAAKKLVRPELLRVTA